MQSSPTLRLKEKGTQLFPHNKHLRVFAMQHDCSVENVHLEAYLHLHVCVCVCMCVGVVFACVCVHVPGPV